MAAFLATYGRPTAVVVAAEDQPLPAAEISASPAITEWLGEPGQKLHKKIVVVNQTNDPQPVRSFVQPFTPREALPKEAEEAYDASDWFLVENPDFIMAPKEHREVTVQLTIPGNASPGGHYATLYFHQLRPADQVRGQATVAGRIGSLAFITVKGDIKKDITPIGELAVTRQQGKYQLTTTLRNTGNTHVLPTVQYRIKDWRGREVGRHMVKPGILLPYTERGYQHIWSPPFVGRYTVEPMITYGNNQTATVPAKTIWQLPWRVIVPVLAAGLFGWFGVYRIWPRWQRAIRVIRRG